MTILTRLSLRSSCGSPVHGTHGKQCGQQPGDSRRLQRWDGLSKVKGQTNQEEGALPSVESHGGLKDGIPAESERKETVNTIAANQSMSGASTTTVIGPSPETQGPNPKKRPIEEPDKIEVIHGPNPARLVHAHTYRAPLGPESAAMEAVDMETYLRVSHIEDADQATRRRLRANGITH
ncbi:hypothetical protein PGT21_009681 [Puccinia graminis f. sp. tritici]|uniref:Uncharacterized protein n=1 Tax=Puccinia graminis f. sp. tritici TaxID=56615 RepID=A0A5B0Q567_PUCGR|nr:hypothetical protein PGT21_009681 [Puccinia graminis f. sp. tritici]